VGRAQTCLLDSVRTSIAPDCFRVRITASAFGHTFGFLKKDPELVREGIDVEVVRAGAPKLHPGSSASNLPSFLTVKNSSYSQRIAFWRGTAHEYEVF